LRMEPGFLCELGACERLWFDARVVFAGALRELPELLADRIAELLDQPDAGVVARMMRAKSGFSTTQ